MALSRKTHDLTRFFRQTINNPKLSIRTRMQAASRLDDLLARHELAAQHDAARKERSDVRALALQSLGGATGALGVPSETVDAAAEEVESPGDDMMTRHLAKLLSDAGLGSAHASR
jgi:hypothetical protein